MMDDGGGVGGEEKLVGADTGHERRPFPRADKHVGVVKRDDRDAEGPLDFEERQRTASARLPFV
jgi:hypothetical protein